MSEDLFNPKSNRSFMLTGFSLTPGGITKGLFGIVGLLLAANIVCVMLKFVYGYDFHFIRMFYFNNESNLPSFYSSAAILGCAFLLFQISHLTLEGNQGRGWRLLGYIFIFLAVDEFISIHENLTGITRRAIGDADGILHYAWVVPYMSLCIVGFVVLFRFFYHLPIALKVKFLFAGFVFIMGAVVLEMLSGKHEALHGTSHTLTYALLSTAEELLEMVGIILFFDALARHYVENVSGHFLRFSIEMRKSTVYATSLSAGEALASEAEYNQRVGVDREAVKK